MIASQENQLPSQQLQRELECHIATRTGRRVRDLRVEVQPGAVVLRGRTDSYYVKQLAQHGARELLPRVRLDNAITVDGAGPPAGEFPLGTLSEFAGG
jgi:hypothetical protein